MAENRVPGTCCTVWQEHEIRNLRISDDHGLVRPDDQLHIRKKTDTGINSTSIAIKKHWMAKNIHTYRHISINFMFEYWIIYIYIGIYIYISNSKYNIQPPWKQQTCLVPLGATAISQLPTPAFDIASAPWNIGNLPWSHCKDFFMLVMPLRSNTLVSNKHKANCIIKIHIY